MTQKTGKGKNQKNKGGGKENKYWKTSDFKWENILPQIVLPVISFFLFFPKFKKAINNIPIQTLQIVAEDELKFQYRLFLERLFDLTKGINLDKLKEIDSKVLILKFFYPENELFKSIEVIMNAIAVSAVKHSCESILESFVSRYENHFDVRRNTKETSTNEEFTIAVNGPSLAHCDAVVLEAMNSYCAERGSNWIFFRTTVLEEDSTVVKRLSKVKNTFPFMN